MLRLAFDNPALVSRFGTGDHAENLALAVRETLGLHVRVEAVGGPSAAEPTRTVSAGVAAATGMTPVVTKAAQPAAASGRGTSPEPPLPTEPPADDEYDDISDDDVRDTEGQLTGAEAVAKLLGGTVISD